MQFRRNQRFALVGSVRSHIILQHIYILRYITAQGTDRTKRSSMICDSMLCSLRWECSRRVLCHHALYHPCPAYALMSRPPATKEKPSKTRNRCEIVVLHEEFRMCGYSTREVVSTSPSHFGPALHVDAKPARGEIRCGFLVEEGCTYGDIFGC